VGDELGQFVFVPVSASRILLPIRRVDFVFVECEGDVVDIVGCFGFLGESEPLLDACEKILKDFSRKIRVELDLFWYPTLDIGFVDFPVSRNPVGVFVERNGSKPSRIEIHDDLKGLRKLFRV
jgi:hypothetical protein